MIMRIILILCVSLLLFLAACATTKPEGQFESQSLDRLPWAKPSYFSSLSSELDFFPNELIAIFHSTEGQPNIILNNALKNAINKGLKVNGILIQPGSIVLLDTYPTNATVPAVALKPGPVCGEIISNFRYSFPVLSPKFLPKLPPRERELQQAIDTLIAISDTQLQAQGKELYGISPKGKAPGTTKSKAAGTLVSPTSSNQASLYGSSLTPAFTSTNWSYQAVNANPKANAAGVRVAVLDTGVNPVGSLKSLLDSPANFVTLQPGTNLPTQIANDDFDDRYRATPYQDGHGTGVAALIADQTYGIAPDATIIPVKTCNQFGICDDITVTRGICYAQSVGADVINLSLGTLSNAPMLQQAINEVVASGTTVVAAAGNTNNSVQFSGKRQNQAAYPAAWAATSTGFMSVGAIDQKLAYADFATSHDSVELVAPGSDLQTGTALADLTGIETYAADGTSGVLMEGTSFAAPMVAAAAANLYYKCSSVSTAFGPAWVEANLLKTSTPWKPTSQDSFRPLPWPLAATRFTPGIVNVGNSLNMRCP
jgi:hypothetical protein